MNRTGILMAKWDSSRSTEIRDQERAAILPEPNSGIMLSIGLFALIYYLGRTRVLEGERSASQMHGIEIVVQK